jgi:hypothetical protein
MLQLSPHGEIAFPMAVNKGNVAHAVKIKAEVGLLTMPLPNLQERLFFRDVLMQIYGPRACGE